MTLQQLLPILLILLCASFAEANRPEPVTAHKPIEADQGNLPGDDLALLEREQALQEFIAVRSEFADLLVSLMSKEELAARVREASVEVRLEQAEERLSQVQRRLKTIEKEGRVKSDEAQRLSVRARKLKTEVVSLRELLKGTVQEQDDSVVTKVITGQFRKDVEEETEHLADVLDTSELQKQTAQLHRVVKLGQFTGSLKALGEEPKQIDDIPPTIVIPSGRAVEPEDDIK